MIRRGLCVVGLIIVLVMGCAPPERVHVYPSVDREQRLPADIAKRDPLSDRHPPSLRSDEYEQPIPLPYPINTSGAEDSPFVTPDGNTLYFFFTPDVRVPHDKQLTDEVTGIYVSHRTNETWTKPERLWLSPPGMLSMDGAVCVQGDEMWFASVREGCEGPNMFTARRIDGRWVNWEYAGDRLMKELGIGEVHIHGDDLYFHSPRVGGRGEYDIWVTTRSGGAWSDPVNIEAVNTEAMDGFPFVNSDGTELWFCRTHMGTPAVFRSRRTANAWGEPELIVSTFAGEPTLDDDGNLYFIHHYFEDGVMIEADIYVAYRRHE